MVSVLGKSSPIVIIDDEFKKTHLSDETLNKNGEYEEEEEEEQRIPSSESGDRQSTNNRKITGRSTNGIDPFAFVCDFLMQRYENLFKYCCICLVRRRRKIVSYSNSCSVAENSTITPSKYRVEYDPNTLIPVISYRVANSIKIE